jgi:PhzF family phenazine biosynthesis protein
MTPTRIRTVDAFADNAFSGNPAGVVVLEQYPADAWMQSMATEMNLSETAFVVAVDDPDADFRLRWFTPVSEVDLCGHATLGAAHCLFSDSVDGPIRFSTRSGVLTVSQAGDALTMDFPAGPAGRIDAPDGLADALGAEPVWVGRGGTNDVLCELAHEAAVRDVTPDMTVLARVEARGVIVTAAAASGGDYDFVSRFFAPREGIVEDPVTGSAHTVLGPYWAERLGHTLLTGFQASPRGGRVGVEVLGDRVILTGRAVLMIDGLLSRDATAAMA